MRVLLRCGASVVETAYGKSMHDQLAELGASHTRGPHYEELRAQLHVGIDAVTVEAHPADVQGPPPPGAVPFARAAPTADAASEAMFGTSVACPLAELHRRGISLPPKRPQVAVGCVVVPRTASGATVLTQRRREMRTFPSAWVFPGGHLDPGESPAQAAARELREETGLQVGGGGLQLVAMWESVFPTTADGCAEAGLVKGHFLVLIYSADVGAVGLPTLAVQEEEVSNAVCMPDTLWRQAALGGVADATPIPSLRGEVRAGELHGIYPNGLGEGVAQGHIYAVGVLFGLHEEWRQRSKAHI